MNKLYNKSKKSIQQRLAGYSALAGAFIAGGIEDGVAQIVYVDVEPDLVVTDTTHGIDFDGDNVNDIVLVHFYQPEDRAGSRIGSDIDNPFTLQNRLIGAQATYGGATYLYPFVMGNGDPIGLSASSSLYPIEFAGGPQQASLWFAFYANQVGYGYWAGASNGYLGVEFQAGSSEIHYAWVELSISDVFEEHDFTLHGYAYQSTPDTPIDAGDQGSVGVSENLKRNSRIFSHNGIVNIRLNNMTDFNGLVTIKDITGKEIYNDQISGLVNQINLQSESTGVYFVQLFDNGGYVTKKVYVSDN